MTREKRIAQNGGGTVEAARPSGRVTVYDWLRLIATVYVVVGHSAYLKMSSTHGGVAYALPENLNPLYNASWIKLIRQMSHWVYGFHMPLFFMLSGAVLALRPLPTFDKLVRDKLKRLIIPYYVYGWLFMLPVKRLGNFYDSDSIWLALKGFLSGDDGGHLWFLIALFWCIILFVVIRKLLERLNIHSIYAVLLVAVVVHFTYSYLPFDLLKLKRGLSYHIYFALGYVFENERRQHARWSIPRTLVALAILIGLDRLNVAHGALNDFFIVLVCCFLTYLLSDLIDRATPGANENRVWKALTQNLFYVYLFHDPLNYLILRVFMNRGLLSGGLGCVAYMLARTVGVFVASLLLGMAISWIKRRISAFSASRSGAPEKA